MELLYSLAHLQCDIIGDSRDSGNTCSNQIEAWKQIPAYKQSPTTSKISPVTRNYRNKGIKSSKGNFLAIATIHSIINRYLLLVSIPLKFLFKKGITTIKGKIDYRHDIQRFNSCGTQGMILPNPLLSISLCEKILPSLQCNQIVRTVL